MEKQKHIKTDSRQEIKFDLHVIFEDGRVLYLCDYLDEIFSYLNMWNSMMDYCIIKKNSL